MSHLDKLANLVNVWARLYVDAMEVAASATGPDRERLQAGAVETFMQLHEAVQQYEAAIDQAVRKAQDLATRGRKLAAAAGGQAS